MANACLILGRKRSVEIAIVRLPRDQIISDIPKYQKQPFTSHGVAGPSSPDDGPRRAFPTVIRPPMTETTRVPKASTVLHDAHMISCVQGSSPIMVFQELFRLGLPFDAVA